MSSSSGAKTQKPTPKRLEDARKKGQVPMSRDLSSATLWIVVFIFLWMFGRSFGIFILQTFRELFGNAANFQGKMTEEVVSGFIFQGLMGLVWILFPLLILIFISGFAVNFLQVGPLFSTDRIKPSFSNLSPAPGQPAKLFTSRSSAGVGKTIFKILLILLIFIYVFWSEKNGIVQLPVKSIGFSVSYIFGLIVEIGLIIGFVFFVLGVADYFLQRYYHKRDLKMTRFEVKEEIKETEGDPLIRAKRKKLQRELTTEGMVEALRKADVVISGQKKIAIAIQYKKGESNAPVVLAKGKELMADQLRLLAKEFKVPVKRDLSLANSLFKIELNKEIPETLFEDVARVLKWVYQMKKR